MKNVVLLSTRRLPPAYFDTVREDLGDPNVTLDVVGWVAPAGPVADKVNSFTLIGPGRMPVAPTPEPVEEADPTEEAPDAVIAPEAVAGPEAVTADEAEVAPAAAEVSDAGPAPEPQPAPAPKPKPTGAKRVVKAVQWRYRRARKVAGRILPKAIKTSAPVKFLRGNRASKDLGKTYWGRILTRRDVLTTIEKADVVVALDAGAIWAGWNLGQRRAGTPVVLGIPAARRELDMLKAPAGNG
ncbi:hypothetical protein ACGFIF_32825 [Kribbella sp. NPDC049174]|uniref:hypothetical protein n=1 Tax=Kribbella sp. NPDC049174 TaxID=3364112 RepID=UPI0037147E2A